MAKAQDMMLEILSPVVSGVAIVAVAVLGARGARQTAHLTATTPAYSDLAEEVRSTRTRMDDLDKALDAERKLRRNLEDRVGDLEESQADDRGWMRRTIATIWRQDPALGRQLRPFPEWLTDPDGPRLYNDGPPGGAPSHP